MLTTLLNLLEQNQGELDLQQISRQLGAEPSAVAGMVALLVHKGRLVEVTPACGFCESCPLHVQCNLPVRRVRRYEVRQKLPAAC